MAPNDNGRDGMKIRIIGGGPAGLCFAALMKRDNPAHDIVIYERGPRDATWGFGVVFSDRASSFLREQNAQRFGTRCDWRPKPTRSCIPRRMRHERRSAMNGIDLSNWE